MDLLRTKVSGAKNRFIDDTYNLDLSYITPRLIAMAFPASGFESLYRNHVDDVANFLNERHNSDFLIFNLSGKKYDNNKFKNKVNKPFNKKVQEYEWVDHHAPTLKILFIICREIHILLSCIIILHINFITFFTIK